MSEESVHADRHVRSEVHKETQQQPNPPPQGEGSATNMEGSSYANRDVEVERLRKQVALLQRNAKKSKELLRRKDKELHHQRRLSLTPSHSRGDEHGVGDRNRKRDKRSPHPHGERERLKGLITHLLIRVEKRSKIGRGLKA